MAGEPVQQGVQLRALVGAEGRQELLLCLGHGTSGLGQPRLSRWRQADEVASPVGGIPGTDDETVGLEGVQQADEVAGVDPEGAAEFLLGQGSRIVEVVEDSELVRPHLEGLQRATELIAGDAREPEDQHRMAGDAGLGAGSGSGRLIHDLYSSDTL